ncbi:TULIP family P47-like protein [Methanococcus maripaludis]|uniref:Protein OrfX2/OrfX3/P47 domain-containing protein n=1 Tax=Methanococcus maripaludis TaxID=39152 RepID=A0A7J9PMP8_METMI|nr:TULIP family P47-like protein [Methanococcus maripaludis]MBA2864044.1 hypothetical protein [Methanococcus maripaludis]MBB6495995.1 hypothetical protein [Methanococcus maripaludis]
MSKDSERVVFSGMNQPVKLDLPNLNMSAIETLKNSALYKNAAKVREYSEEQDKLMLATSLTTNGWDTVSICRVTALNERIKEQKTYPESISTTSNQLSLNGDFDAWSVITGGDGKNVKLKLPMKSGTYVGMEFGSGTNFDLTGVSVEIYVKLNYFPITNPEAIADGDYSLYVKTEEGNSSDPIAAVVSLNDPSGKIDDINISILRGLYEQWLNIPENLRKFDTLFATVLINNMGEQSDEYRWLRATTISYAYTDKGTEDSSIFGILCMTNDRSADGLPNQLPAVILEKDNNAIFLINREIFVRYQLVPSLPFIFSDSPDAEYVIDEAGTTVNAENIQLDKVRVGAIDYQPIAKSFEMCFDETYIRTTAKIFTNISPGIDANTIIMTKQTLALGYNDQGEQVMTYEMVGDPVVENSTDIATWIVVTEAIVALIGAVVTGVAAKVAEKLTALIVGIIVAAVIALVTVVIHVIIEKVIAGGVTDSLPSISPMVKVATNQVKWPFCTEDAFVLTDIDYSGAIIFEGNLNLLDGYAIQNNRLVYTGI